jgi:hypothetical protein
VEARLPARHSATCWWQARKSWPICVVAALPLNKRPMTPVFWWLAASRRDFSDDDRDVLDRLAQGPLSIAELIAEIAVLLPNRRIKDLERRGWCDAPASRPPALHVWAASPAGTAAARQAPIDGLAEWAEAKALCNGWCTFSRIEHRAGEQDHRR